MPFPPPTAAVRAALVLLAVIVTLTLTLTVALKGGQLTGWPFLRAETPRTPLEEMADQMLGRVGYLTDQLRAQAARITDLGVQITQVTQLVFFTVTFSDRHVGDLGTDQTLKFDRVLHNAGDGYRPRTGLFTAPTAGLYAFHLQVSRHPSDLSSCVEVELVHSFQRHPHPSLSTRQGSPPGSRREQRPQLARQRRSLSALTDHRHHHQQQSSPPLRTEEEKVCTLTLCLHDTNSTSGRAVVRLAQGDTVQAVLRSGTMLLGDIFTSMSGLRLPVLSPLFRPLML